MMCHIQRWNIREKVAHLRGVMWKDECCLILTNRDESRVIHNVHTY